MIDFHIPPTPKGSKEVDIWSHLNQLEYETEPFNGSYINELRTLEAAFSNFYSNFTLESKTILEDSHIDFKDKAFTTVKTNENYLTIAKHLKRCVDFYDSRTTLQFKADDAATLVTDFNYTLRIQVTVRYDLNNEEREVHYNSVLPAIDFDSLSVLIKDVVQNNSGHKKLHIFLKDYMELNDLSNLKDSDDFSWREPDISEIKKRRKIALDGLSDYEVAIMLEQGV